MKVYQKITDLIGGTPLLELANLEAKEALPAKIYGKMEYFNPAGSVKDRIAKGMIDDAEAKGLLKPGSVIIEPTSGNTGIGLASIAAARGYRLIIAMPETMSVERRNILKAYGAEIVLTQGVKGMKGAIERAKELAEEIPGGFIPGQFENPANPEAHLMHTAVEILEQAGKPIHGFCCGIGTGGTITGIGKMLKSENPHTEIWAVEPEHAAILSGGCIGTHLQMGIGDGVIPPVLDKAIYDDICIITDAEALETARKLAKREGLLVGISSGTNVAAAIRLARKLGRGKTVVTLLPDTAERYFSTPLFENE